MKSSEKILKDSSVLLMSFITFIDYCWFGKAIEERRDLWQINYEPVSGKEIKQSEYKKMISVVEGYPNMIIYREKEPETTAVIN